MNSSTKSIANSPPPIGIVIPTFNRHEHLLECLRHLERQTWMEFEVVVVDDGSTDATQEVIAKYKHGAPFPLRYFRQANLGPATGRNRAIAQLESPLCILIGDDIFPSSDFVRTHLEFHRLHQDTEAVALGLTQWSKQGQKVTRFMRWSGWDGAQFAYAGLMRGESPSWKHFYTSNLSFKTDYLKLNPFNEGFPGAAMEDIELGYRLAARHGLRMYFLAGALADHLHPTTFKATCRRMLSAGEGAYLFGQLWPEHRRSTPQSVLKRVLLRAMTEQRLVLPVLTELADLSIGLACPNPLVRRVLFLHELIGYNRAMEAASKPETIATTQGKRSAVVEGIDGR